LLQFGGGKRRHCALLSPAFHRASGTGDAAALLDREQPRAIAIANAIARLWRDKGLRGEMAMRGRERAKEFSPARRE
jgi:hypothetical protein